MSKTYRCEKCGDMIPLDEVIETLNSGYIDADGEAWRDIFIEALRKRYGVNDD